MDRLYKRCLEDIELQKPGAQQALADFEEQCVARIQDVLKVRYPQLDDVR